MNGIRRVYWDTSVFVCFLNPTEDKRRLIARENLKHAELGKIEIFTSVITLAEAIKPKGVAGKDVTQEQRRRIRAMFDWQFIRLCLLDKNVAVIASELRLDHGMRTPDAIHAATAIALRNNPSVKLDALQHWDSDYAPVSAKVPVENPSYFSPLGPLFGGLPGFPEG
jgi:predicted nucleic acid-binding protein